MQEVIINEVNINYIKKGEGPALLILHGIYRNIYAYKKLIKILSRKYTVYVLDLPMHGKSGYPKCDVNINYFTKVIEEFVKIKKITKPSIIAHSGGGTIALDYASKNKNIKELYLFDSSGVKSHNTVKELFTALAIKNLKNLFRHPIKLTLNWSYTLFCMKNINKEKYMKIIKDNLTKSSIPNMKKITCKTTLAWSENDSITKFSTTKEFLKHIKNSKLIIVNGDHDWPIYKPKEIKKVFNV